MEAAGFLFEKELWFSGKNLIAGVDEVGRGAWAGPLVVGAVIFSPSSIITEPLYDSKLISQNRREKLAAAIKDRAVALAIYQVGPEIIDEIGLTAATQHAFSQVIQKLDFEPDHILVDAYPIKSFDPNKQTPIIHGDELSGTIAAASIIAKVCRDDLMADLAYRYPQYAFEKNKGYGTRYHRWALDRFGPSTVHRQSFANIAARSNQGVTN